MDKVSFVEELVTKLVAKREELDVKASEKSALEKELRELKGKALEVLNELDLDDYRGKAGTITRKTKWSVKIPQTVEDKNKLISFLKGKDLHDRYVTFNSRAVNTLNMDSWELAKEEGRGMEFNVPGIEAPKSFDDLGLRKR